MRTHSSRYGGALLWVLWLAAWGCARARPLAEVSTARSSGAYDYVLNLPGHESHGVLAVLRDSIWVQPSEGFCTGQPVRGAETVVFNCVGIGRFGSVTLYLNRANVIQGSSWTASEPGQRQERYCAEYQTLPSGQTRCVRYELRVVDVVVRHSGRLLVRPRLIPG
jgi:hypothetical protein